MGLKSCVKGSGAFLSFLLGSILFVFASYSIPAAAPSSAAGSDQQGTSSHMPGWLGSGTAGYALDFDGNDYCEAADHPALSLTINNAFTLEAWVYRRPEGNYWQVALSKGNTDPYGLTVSGDEFLHFELEGSQLNTPPASVPFNTWTHIAGTWDGNTMRAYVNGVELASMSKSALLSPSELPFLIGAAGYTPHEFWNGVIDEVRMWNVARSATEIRDSSATMLMGTEPGLVAYWQFDEGSGQEANDTTTNGITIRLGSSPGSDDSDPEWVTSEIPGFLASSLGRVTFDSTAYACVDIATVELWDADLVGSATWFVRISSSEGDFEELVLTETYESSPWFVGSISIEAATPVTEDGKLQVSHGETITAWYWDEDTGSGSPDAVIDTALIDCEPPVISGVLAVGLAPGVVRVSFDTDETSFATINYGTQCGVLPNTAESGPAAEAHEIILTRLQPETQYFFTVEATDLVGQTSLDDNDGSCYSFVTGPPEDESYLDFQEDDLGWSDFHPAFDFAVRNQFTFEVLVKARWRGWNPKPLIYSQNGVPVKVSLSKLHELVIVLVNDRGPIELITPPDSVPDDSWCHVAVSSDGVTLKAWVNGVERGSTPVAGSIKPNWNGIQLGDTDMWAASVQWASMDEVRIWNVARSVKQIRNFMFCSLEGNEPGLVAYWKLNEGFGQWAFDRTPNQIHLRLGSTEEEDDEDPTWVRWLAVVGPPCPTTSDDLECVLQSGVIGDATEPEISYQWFRNGREIPKLLVVGDDLFFSTEATLSHHFTAKNETFYCLVDIVDGTSESRGQTPPLLIHNSTPTAPVVDIIPDHPVATDGLTAFVTQFSTDADGDGIGYAIRWYRSQDGGQTFDLIPILTWLTVPPGYLAEGDIWRVEILPFEIADPDVEGEIGWDQVYVGVNSRPTVTVTRPGPENAIAMPLVTIAWEADDIDGDAVTVDLFYDTDDIEGGALPIVMDQPESGFMTWEPPGAGEAMASVDLSGDGLVDAEDLFILASRWYDLTEAARYRIFARAWDEKGAIGEAFSPGEIIVPAGLPTNVQGLLQLLREWSQE
jgi:hypothetical protein